MRYISRGFRAGFHGFRNRMFNFLKPDLWKLLLTFVLFYVSSFLWRAYIITRISDTFPLGFPFQFYMAWGPCPTEQICSAFNGFLLLFDLTAWYVVSAFLVNSIRKT